jgi:hypothetical protein
MDWELAPAMLAAGLMTLFGVGAVVRPNALREMIGIAATTPLGVSEIRAVFGGMFIALGMVCLLARDPVVFGVVAAAWFVDFLVRCVAVFADRVPARQALPVLGIALSMGMALMSGYWRA